MHVMNSSSLHRAFMTSGEALTPVSQCKGFRALFPALLKVREETGSDSWVRHWRLAH